MTSQLYEMNSSSICLTLFCFFVSLVNFSYWSKFHVNIITGSGLVTIFFFIRDRLEMRKLEMPPSDFCPISGYRSKLGIPNLARMFFIKYYRMLRNSRVTGFTISELLNENPQNQFPHPPTTYPD